MRRVSILGRTRVLALVTLFVLMAPSVLFAAVSLKMVASGRNHSVSLVSDGTVWAWGKNASGQLGNGTFVDSDTLVRVVGLSKIMAVTAAAEFSLALKSDGSVWSWGTNKNGELGIGTFDNSNLPKQIIGLTGVTALSGGDYFSLALKSDGTVWAWGYGGNGELGNGANNNSNVPVQVSGLTSVTAIDGSVSHSLALKSDGTVWAWGYGLNGELGNGVNANRNVPTQIPGLTGVSAIATVDKQSIAYKSDGSIWAWGAEEDGASENALNIGSNVPIQTGINLSEIGIGETPITLPVITITTSTKLSRSNILDTRVQVTDKDAISAYRVNASSSSATLDAFNCVQTSETSVDCRVSIKTSGSLIINATNDAGKSSQAIEAGYIVDTISPVVRINGPSLRSSEPIDDTRVQITDNVAVFVSAVSIGGSARPEAVVCSQTTAAQVDCILRITGSGSLTVYARDKAGNASMPAARDGYEIRANLDQPSGGGLIGALKTPAAQETANVVSPLVLTVSIVNVASSFSLFNVFALIQSLFAHPLLLLDRRKRKRWGIVYNSYTKAPVELAIVRLVHPETRLVIQSRITDRFGRYWFFVKRGNYQLEVVKPGFIFPSRYLLNRTVDVEYTDLYHGGGVDLLEDSAIARNIPMDPVYREEAPRLVLFKSVLYKFKAAWALGGVFLSLIAFVISTNTLSFVLFLAQIGMYFLFRRLGKPSKAKNWGRVMDARTHKPLPHAIVRIFLAKYNKLLETQVTDQYGKYSFFVRENIYLLKVEKSGYRSYTSSEMDLRGKKESVVDQDILLQPLDDTPKT